MRSEQEKAQIRSIVSSPQWETIKLVAEEFCSKSKNDVTAGNTEWDTLKDTLLAEGKAQGIRQFLQELIKESSYGDE